MKQSQLYILITNIFIVGSFIAHSIFASLIMLLFAFVLMTFALKMQNREHRIDHLKNLIDQREFELVIAILNDIGKRRTKK